MRVTGNGFFGKMAELARIQYVDNKTSYELVRRLTLTRKCTFYLVIHIFRMSKPNGNGQIFFCVQFYNYDVSRCK